MNLDLTEDMIDAVLIKVDADNYNDSEESSASDLDEDINAQVISANDSDESSETDSQTSDDFSPVEVSEKRVSFNINDIKLRQSEVRLTPIDASFLPLKNTINSDPVKNVKPDVASVNVSCGNGETLKIDDSIEQLSEVNGDLTRNPLNIIEMPGKSGKFKIVKKISKEAHMTNDNSEKPSKCNETMEEIRKINRNIEGAYALKGIVETESKGNNIGKVVKQHYVVIPKKAPKTVEHLGGTLSVNETVAKPLKANGMACKVSEKTEDSNELITVCPDRHDRDIQSTSTINSKINENRFKFGASSLVCKVLNTLSSNDFKPLAAIKSTSNSSTNNIETKSVANKMKIENITTEATESKNELFAKKNSSEFFDNENDDDESDHDGLCIDLKMEDVNDSDNSSKNNKTSSSHPDVKNVNSEVCKVSLTKHSNNPEKPLETESVLSDKSIKNTNSFEMAVENEGTNCFANLLESTKELMSGIKPVKTTNENQLTLYGESDVPSVVTVQLACESCARFVKKETNSDKSSSINYIIVKDESCEICKNKDQSTSKAKISTEQEKSSSMSNKATVNSAPLSNVEKTIESVARNFSKDCENSASCSKEISAKTSCQSVLEDILKTAGCSNKSESVLTSSSQDNVIVLKSTNPTSTKSVFSKRNNIIIKDPAMKTALANASKTLKPSGTTTLDGKLYKVILLPKTVSTKTSITTSAAMKNAGEKILQNLDPIAVKVISTETPVSTVSSTTTPISSSFSSTAVSKLVSLNSQCILTPAESTSVSSNPCLKKIISTPILSSAEISTVPNKQVFSPAKSTTSFLSSISSSQLLKKKPSLLSIIKSDGSKFKATERTSFVRNTINKKMSVDSSGAPSTSPEKSKFIALHDYMSLKPVSSNTISVNSVISSPFLPPKTATMKSLEPDKNPPIKITQPVLMNNPTSMISLKNITRNRLVVNDEDAIPMSTTVFPKRPQFNHLDSEKASASYLSNFLDEGAKEAILNSILLPPFTPTVPDSVYDANNPVAKFSCAQCPDTFTSTEHLQNHLSRRSVLLKYNCPLCLNKLIIVYNRCMLKQHCEMHKVPVFLKCLTIEPLPLALFDLNLFNSRTDESSNSAINVPTVAADTNISKKPKRPRKSRAKSKKTNLSPEENKATSENSSLDAGTTLAPNNSTGIPNEATDSLSTCGKSDITLHSASPEKSVPEKPVVEKKLDILTYCGECQTTFSSLSAHLQESGKPDSAYTCECKRICPSLCSLKAHTRLHNKKPPHSCPECGSSFLFASALDDHFKKSCYHPFKKNSYQCLKCNQNFSVIQKLEWHVLRNHTRQVNICGICEFSSPDSATVSDHLSRDHTDQVAYASYRILRFMECDFCPKTNFPRHQNRQHIQSHTKQKSSFTPNYYYQCDCCFVYKTLNKVDFGQHLDYCLFSTSLRSLEDCSQEDDLDLSDVENSTRSTLDSKVSIIEDVQFDNKAPVTNHIEKSHDNCQPIESVETESSTSASDKICSVQSCESNSSTKKMSKSVKRIRINLEVHTIKSSEPSKQMETSAEKRCIFQCKYCPQKFFNRKKVFNHLKFQHFDVISGPRLAVKRKIVPSLLPKPKVMKNADNDLKSESAENSSFECSKCNFIGATYEDLFNHMETHKTIYECQECTEIFVARPSLEKHLIVTHQFDMKKAKSIVESNSSNLEVVKENGAYIAKQGFYQCATCYKNFTSEESFDVHFRTHGLAFVTDSVSPTTLIK